MKRLALSFLFAFATAVAFSQNIHFGFKAGLNLSHLTGDNPYYDDRAIPGFSAGIIADIGLHNFSLQPGVFFTTKGEKQAHDLLDANGNKIGELSLQIKLNYIEIPVNLLYHISAAPGVNIYFGGGPYLGYGLNGSTYFNHKSYPINFKNEQNPNTASYKNPDMGVNIVAGVLLHKRFMIDGGYGWGLTGLSWGSNSYQNRVFHISLGYFFR